MTTDERIDVLEKAVSLITKRLGPQVEQLVHEMSSLPKHEGHYRLEHLLAAPITEPIGPRKV